MLKGCLKTMAMGGMIMMNKITVGTRGSKLALIQANLVKDALKLTCPELEIEIKIIKTTGDKISDIPLEKIGDKGVFIKELEAALLNEEIDLAVHSMKDLPTALPAELEIGAMMTREEPWEVMLTGGKAKKLSELQPGARIGSSSLRRRAQLLHHFPHLEVCSIRGNLDTRLKKMQRGDFDAIILAYAGVKRMGWDALISEVIPVEICLPAVGQGAIGLEIRAGDKKIAEIATFLNCSLTETAILAERAFLRKLEGGCQVPVGALAEIKGSELCLTGMVASLDGGKIYLGEETGKPVQAETVGAGLAERLLKQGCGHILEQIRQEC